MRKNKKVVDNQITIFDYMQVTIFDYMQEIERIDGEKEAAVKIKTAATIKKSPIDDTLYKFKKIINLYKDSCNTIIKTASGALVIEFDKKYIYFNSNAIKEFETFAARPILPCDEILIVNKDKSLNEIQLNKLKELCIEKYIKRKGDNSLIIEGETTRVINPKGWVLDYNMKPIYNENEIVYNEIEKKITNYKVGDIVKAKYLDDEIVGEITRIYNNNETINIKFNNKVTAFYYKNVFKVTS